MYANVRYARIYNMYFKVEPHRATAPPLQLCTCFLWLLFPEVLASYTSKTIVNLSVHRQTYRNKQSIHISSPVHISWWLLLKSWTKSLCESCYLLCGSS